MTEKTSGLMPGSVDPTIQRMDDFRVRGGGGRGRTRETMTFLEDGQRYAPKPTYPLNAFPNVSPRFRPLYFGHPVKMFQNHVLKIRNFCRKKALPGPLADPGGRDPRVKIKRRTQAWIIPHHYIITSHHSTSCYIQINSD